MVLKSPSDRRCFYCGRGLTRKTATKDHVRPVVSGGTTNKKNLVDACRRCNEEKGRLSLDEFRVVMAFRKKIISRPKFRFPGEK